MANEKRLIDANVFAEHLERMVRRAYPNMFPGLLEAVQYAKDFPTVDAVEVVRCKECEFFKDTWKHDNGTVYGYCPHLAIEHSENGYCHYGERKDNGTTQV